MNSLERLRAHGYYVLGKAIPSRIVAALESSVWNTDFSQVTETEWRLERADEHLALEGLWMAASINEALGLLHPRSTYLVRNRHNHVGVSFGGGYRSSRFHRDAQSWDNAYTTVLVPLSGFDHTDSRVQLIPGSNHLTPDGPLNGGGYWLDEGPYASLAAQAVEVNLRPGDVLLLDPMTFHAAGFGRATLPRVMLSLGVTAGNELLLQQMGNLRLIRGEGVPYEGQAWYVRK